jgi:predicted nucleic acid-binding protein
MELRFVADLVRRFKIVTPSERHWFRSAEILSHIGKGKGYGRQKLRQLAFDALIALSAREIGATLVTLNREDFEEIRKQVPFNVLYW